MREGLQNKMYDYEVTPPSNIWEKIAAALDESAMTHEFPSTLYNMELAPPPATWEKIKNSLDGESEATLPEKKRFYPLLRYAAAAAVIGLIAFGSLQILKKKRPGKNETVKGQVIQPSKNNPVSPMNDTTAKEKTVNNTSLQDTNQVIAKIDIPARIRRHIIHDNLSFEPTYFPDAGMNRGAEDNSPQLHGEVNITSAVSHDDIKTDNSSRYIMLMTPDGNIIRMSKKLSDLVCCVSGQDEDEGCKSQLKLWREKMVSSSVAPGNFIDLLNLVCTLQDNSD